MTAELRTLRELVQSEGPLSVRDAVGWITRAAKTVAFIHQNQRVHGALSADAIYLGGADCASEGSLAHPADLDAVAEYHSRDRCEYDELSVEDDVWALGVTLFYAVTGTVPFPRGVVSWVEAGNRMPPPAAMYGSDLSGMDSVLGLLLNPLMAPEDILNAALLVAQLAVVSPGTAELPPLQLQTPRAGPLDMSATLEQMPSVFGSLGVGLPDEPSEPPLPNHALLMSLPPAPMPSRTPRAPVQPAAPRRWLWLVGVAAVAAVVGVAIAWLLLRG